MNSRLAALVLPLFLLGAVPFLPVRPAAGSDQEGCMLCHRLPLRLQTDNGARSMTLHDAPGGSHDALYCSDCHTDARNVPHPSPPGPAQCVGECHGGTASSLLSHRNAGYGGLTEGHRSLVLPGTPCKLCHRAEDGKEGRKVLRSRCVSCHFAERAEVDRGPHGRVRGGSCVDCHPVHPAAVAGGGPGKTTCAGVGCHRASTPGMVSLVRHGSRGSGHSMGNRALHGALFLGIVAAGWILGAALSPPPSRKGEDL